MCTGNVWDWAETVTEHGERRVLRDGSGDLGARSARSASRSGIRPDVRDYSIGFRFARDQPDQSRGADAVIQATRNRGPTSRGR